MLEEYDKDFTYDNLTNLVIQSVKFIGKDNVDKKTIDIIKSRLSKQQIINIKKTTTQTSQWIKNILASF